MDLYIICITLLITILKRTCYSRYFSFLKIKFDSISTMRYFASLKCYGGKGFRYLTFRPTLWNIRICKSVLPSSRYMFRF